MELDLNPTALFPSDPGPLGRARRLFGHLARSVRAALPRSSPPPASTVTSATSAPDPGPERALLADPAFAGVRLVDGPRGMLVVWRLAGERILAAQSIAPEPSEIRLRTVRVSWPAAASEPRVEHVDHGPVRNEGSFPVPRRRPGERIVASLGLGDAARLVSIDHATLS